MSALTESEPYDFLGKTDISDVQVGSTMNNIVQS